jgi:vanillate O-demethylase monooxygenase subunit
MPSPSATGAHPALRSCWHPVAYSDALESDPIPTTLLGESLALWRDSKGAVHASSDLCIHRGTALSLGSVQGDELVCPYHAWRYAADGRCTAIPQLADPTRVPAKARIAAYRCRERYGVIWVALDQPRWDLPDVPEHTVETDGHVLRYEVVRPEAPNSDAFPVFSNPDQETPLRRSRYELHLPYSLYLRLGWGGREGMVYFFASQPVDHDRCRGFLVIGRNYNHDQPDQMLVDFEDVIFDQDKRVVESQRPDRVPFDLADELHLRFDAVAVAYRRAMRAQGLAAEGDPDQAVASSFSISDV